MTLIDVKNLTKEFKVLKQSESRLGMLTSLIRPRYEMRTAVDAISFKVNRGEMVGYIGPNGAGKSTSLKMLTGVLVPTHGTVSVMGMTPHLDRKNYVKKIGVISGQKSQLWWDLPVIESLKMQKSIYGISQKTFEQNLASFDALLELGDFRNVPVRQLSLGQRMRADLAAALIHDPEILFLDEPTIGLDVLTKKRLRLFLTALNRERGVTVILTTHDMADIEAVCSRIMVVSHGKLICDDDAGRFIKSLAALTTLVVDFEVEQPDLAVEGAQVVFNQGLRARIVFNRAETSAANLILDLCARYPVRDVSTLDADIEKVVRRLYRRRSGNSPALAERRCYRYEMDLPAVWIGKEGESRSAQILNLSQSGIKVRIPESASDGEQCKIVFRPHSEQIDLTVMGRTRYSVKDGSDYYCGIEFTDQPGPELKRVLQRLARTTSWSDVCEDWYG